MSHENVEIAHQIIDAYGRRDTEALRALCHEDLELDWTASRGALAGVYRGVDEALEFFAEYYGVFEETLVEPDRLIDADEYVVIPNLVHQRGRDGIEVSVRNTLVIRIHDRRATHIRLYQETGQALRAVGLAE